MFSSLRKQFIDYHHRTCRLVHGERVKASLARHIGSAASMLDVGCGDGVNTRHVAEAVGAREIVGVDVLVRPSAVIDVRSFDGVSLPFADGSFEVVSFMDVLHHCARPLELLREAMRVAKRLVVIKDHFAFGPISDKVLYAMDIVGNAKDGIPSPGTYFHPAQWVAMISEAGGRIDALEWPLKIHDFPWRIVGWPQLQFTARVMPLR